ncbi:amidohydrolase family protein [Croceitalea sp. MTPC9]|uniref:amidohydrolase family protein n=1 Tax=unclassified Croceitalea TaxID=2632280 RepID=UPI002B3E2D50|nr:amidohydrolase family protein [Croceitalea sp. MTPC6]GMN15357.1 amidohydrolase family protein [Croceitalea sp. MTPC9]
MRPFLVLLACFLLMGCPPLPDKSDIIIKNANVIDIVTGEIEKKDIFITDGRITQIITKGEGDAYYKADVTINAKGKYALPGFWDNHVHFRGGDSLIDDNKNLLKLFIANGITTVRDAGGDLTPQVMEWKTAIEKEELLGPTIFTSGPKIDGSNATWAGSLSVENETDIAMALDSLQRIPTDYLKLYDSRISAEAYLNTIAEAEKRGIISSGHMPFTVEINEAIETGIDGIEHLYYIMKGCSDKEKEVTQMLINKEIGFWGAMPLLLDSYSESTAQQTFKILKEQNVYSIPTLHIGKVLSYLDEVDHSQDEYLKYMGNGIIKTYEGRINRVKNSSPETIQNRKDLDDFFGELAKAMSDAGVSLLAGSDSGAFNSYTYPGISLHKELEAMVAVGISPLQAIQNSAYKGSQFLQKDADYGRLIEGNMADVILLNANPLEDITQTKNLAYVIKGNQILDKKDLAALLASAINNN